MDTFKSITALVLILVMLACAGVMLAKITSAPAVAPSLGALAGPDIPSPYISYGGLQHYASRSTSLSTSTTTPCIIQSPVATSTLAAFGINFTVSSTSAKSVVLAKGAAPQASTTVLGIGVLAANAQGAVIATTSIASDNAIIAPNSYLNVSMVGGAGTDSPVGSCSAEFLVI